MSLVANELTNDADGWVIETLELVVQPLASVAVTV